MTPPDYELLQLYFTTGDQAAFRLLVDRHLPLVHSAALRVTRDSTLAEEASQMVFARLAASHRTPFDRLPLIVWLHRTTRSFAIDLVRAEASRRKREQAAATLAMSLPDPPTAATDISWDHIAPVLDQALDALPEKDRHLILARYFRDDSLAEIARTLGIPLETAKKRSQRALEKLRELLSRRGITTTAAMLALALPAHAVTPVTTELAAAVFSTGAAASAGAAAGSAATTMSTVISAKLFSKAGLAATLAILTGISVPAIRSWHNSRTPAAVGSQGGATNLTTPEAKFSGPLRPGTTNAAGTTTASGGPATNAASATVGGSNTSAGSAIPTLSASEVRQWWQANPRQAASRLLALPAAERETLLRQGALPADAAEKVTSLSLSPAELEALLDSIRAAAR